MEQDCAVLLSYTAGHLQVYTCARGAADLEQALKEWRGRGWDVHGSTVDLAESDGPDKLMAAVSAAFGGQLDVLGMPLWCPRSCCAQSSAR